VLGDTRPLRIWGWLVAGVLLVEALLHTPLGDRIPESAKWGNERLATIVQDAERYSQDGPADILFFGSSQGDTWIEQQELRTRGLRTFNASVPGGNTVLADLLGAQLFIPTLKPKLVVITLGPMSLSAWNQHFVRAVEGSPVGGPILRGDRGSIWINENLMLIRKGGQSLARSTFRAWKLALFGAPKVVGPAERPPDTNIEAQLATFLRLRPDPTQFAAMRHLRDAAEAAGATVVFINMPLKDGAKVGADWNYDEYLAEVRRATAGYPLLDLDALAQDQHFWDYAHPSPAGLEAMRGVVADFVRMQLGGAKRP